jgi:hypothetical protein
MKRRIRKMAEGIGPALSSGLHFFGTAGEREHEKKRRTLGYVSSELDRLDEIGATEKLERAERVGVLNAIGKHPKDTPLFLECIHTFNRIAAGIHDGTLDEEIIFQTWPPRWFERQWETLQDLVRREEEERREVKESFTYFEWLANEKVPKVRDEYPESANED